MSCLQPTLRFLGLVIVLAASGPSAWAVGARLPKSGPITITADGSTVWLVNPDHDSVSRIDTATHMATEFALPTISGPHKPRGLAVTADGSRVWVAAHDSGNIFVLDGTSGAVVQTLAVPFGSGPIAVALSADDTLALVTLHRAAAVAAFDVQNESHITNIYGVFHRPWGATFTSNPDEAWITHSMTEGEDSHITAIDTAGFTIKANLILKSVNPKESPDVQTNYPGEPVAEGGYILTRGHPAQPPGINHLWFPLQYQNFHNSAYNPESTVQSVIHKVDLATLTPLTGNETSNRLVLSAKESHNNNSRIGDGWDAHISGPEDLAFNAAGTTAYLVNEYSNDVLVFPTNITRVRPNGAAALTEITVGESPIGLVPSPTADRLYVHNYLSRTVSVIDTVSETELLQIDTVPGSPEPLSAGVLNGARLFNNSEDPRISSNAKMSCASCHVNGDGDALSWDFAQLGAGSRKTLRLRGLNLSFAPGSGGLGQLHRSGDRDEVQDFDHTFRGITMGGTGFIAGSPNPPLGASNAGLDPDLDDIAAYVLSLDPTQHSPHRDADGTLSAAAERGAMIFKNNTPLSPYNVGCATCHPAPNFTDYGYHDIGGHTPGVENEGPAFNTPSLVGSWDDLPHIQVSGWRDGFTPGGVVRSAGDPTIQAGIHGDTSQLNRTQMRDLEAFLNSIDGQMVADGIAAVADTAGPRVIALLPQSLDAVVVIFDETVDPTTAEDPGNYLLTDGLNDYIPTAATVDTAWGNRVRLDVDLEYFGCAMSYTLIPGPIEDIAFAVSNGTTANNVLDTADAANQAAFDLDGTITVTFGDSGAETYGGVATDAGIIAGLNSWSHARWWLAEFTNPQPMIGFLRFDFANTLTTESGVTNSADIVGASIATQPDYGHHNDIELRRVYKPWQAPPNDWYSGCGGVVTMNQALCGSLGWSSQGANSLGGDGSDPADYYPNSSTFDRSATIDVTATINGLNEPLHFSGPQVTDAFRLWFDNPGINYGYAAQLVDDGLNRSTVFWGSHQEDGFYGAVLSITFNIPVTSTPDCNSNGTADYCDITVGGLADVDGNGIPDVCEVGGECILAETCADLDSSGITDDSCKYFSCNLGSCVSADRHYADFGGQFGSCPVDGIADGHDRFHALNCFSNTDTVGNTGYPCEPNSPAAFNVDAAGISAPCTADGVCDANDAFAALNAFDASTTCACPLDGPTPQAPLTPALVQRSSLVLHAETKRVEPGTTFQVDVYLSEALKDLRGYQLHATVRGGQRGALEIVDVAVDPRPDAAFGGLPAWEAFNVATQQMLAGLDDAGVAVSEQAYLATFTVRASKHALGSFMVDLAVGAPHGRTQLFPSREDGHIHIDRTVAVSIDILPEPIRQRSMSRRD